MRYLITFSYDGTNFHGLEYQPDYRSVEEEMEKALTYINNHQKTKIIASGRTDKGVHARRQTAHVDILVDITEYKLKRAMNSLLPNDIHVIDAKDKDEMNRVFDRFRNLSLRLNAFYLAYSYIEDGYSVDKAYKEIEELEEKE